MNTIREILTLTFDILDKELSSYLVMNKYDELPDILPSDIDIAVTEADFSRLDKIVGKIGNATKLIITQKIWHDFRKCAYILTPLHVTERFRLQLDFFSDFSFRATPLLISSQEFQRHKRQFSRYQVPDYPLEFVFLLMRRIIKNDFNEKHCETLRSILTKDYETVKLYASKYFPGNIIDLVSSHLLVNDVTEMINIRSQLWKSLKKHSNRESRGVYWLRYWIGQIYRAVYRMKYPVGMSIAFLSPDGGGKSAVIKAIQSTCWGTFHYMDLKHFRPRILKNLGHYNPINPTDEALENNHPHVVEMDGIFKSLARFLFYNIDFFIGGVFVKLASVKKTLTIFDRYYYDYFVDLKRYKYNLPKSTPVFFQWMIPSPQIVFILNARPDVIVSRKQELSYSELTRQTEIYRDMSKTIKNARLIDANEPLFKVVDRVTEEILLFKANMTSKAMKLPINEEGVATSRTS